MGHRAHPIKNSVAALLGCFATLALCPMQFGDRSGLNNMSFAQVQALVSDLGKAQLLAKQGNIEFLGGQVVPGQEVRLRGEFTDANCYLGYRTHAYDHAFCAKLCVAAGSSLVFVSDPSVSNGANVSWNQGHEGTRPPEDMSVNLSIQHQLSSSMVLEASYNGVMGAHLQTGLLQYNQVNPAYIQKYGINVLTSNITSPAAIAAGVTSPFPGFAALWGSRATVAQALKAVPQYGNIDTASGGGDHSGHSTYHAGILKLERRLSTGLTMQTSYVFSKILTDSDSYWPASFAADLYNRGLEKSIGAYDVTHNFKMSVVYDLPFGKGKSRLSHGVGAFALGGWRLSGIAGYSSGQPIGVGTSYSLPINNGRTPAYVTSYDGWRAQTQGGSFDPSKDNFFVPYGTGPFPLQGVIPRRAAEE